MNTRRKRRALFKHELHMMLYSRTQDRGAKLLKGRDFPVLKETCMLLEKSEPCRLVLCSKTALRKMKSSVLYYEQSGQLKRDIEFAMW